MYQLSEEGNLIDDPGSFVRKLIPKQVCTNAY